MSTHSGNMEIEPMDNANISIVPADADIEDAETYEDPKGKDSAMVAPLAAIGRPRAIATERFRLIALRIDKALGQRRQKVIVVTSPQNGDGKTTTAISLGATLARDLGKRVTVIDCDLMRPRLARQLGLDVRRGLGEVLRGEARLDEIVWRIGDDPFYVIPGSPAASDVMTPLAALAEVIAAARMRNEYVVLDCPSLAESADAAALARWADGVVMVIRSGATTRDALSGALDSLVDAPLLGCVMNDYDGPMAPAAPGPVRRALPAHRTAAIAVASGDQE